MKKTLVFLGLLSIGFAYAQTDGRGKVGINTNNGSSATDNPRATLDIRVAEVNKTGNTNEGILIPKLAKSRVTGIATANRVEGTLVYVTDNVESGDSANFTGTGKGFYFYNGSKWEKMGSGSSSPSVAAPKMEELVGTVKKYGAGNAHTEVKDTDWDNSAMFVATLGPGTNGNIKLPNPAGKEGKMIAISNYSGGLVTFIVNTPPANTTLSNNRGILLISDGEKWRSIGGF